MKILILVVLSLGLFWFTEEFSPPMFFEPWQGILWRLWVGYARDLIQPFAFYLFLCLGERWLKDWLQRAWVAFSIPTLLEFGQYLYYQVSGSHYVGVFDPWDILMYATGVGLAVLVEQQVFAKWFEFW
jgi:hypothetical protein